MPAALDGADAPDAQQGPSRGRWTGAIGLWAAFVALLPHVVHHVLPFVGGALLTGVAGGVVFAAVGVAAMVPFLIGLRRRFGTWMAPFAALALFGAVFVASTVLVGPLVRGALTYGTPDDAYPSVHPSHPSHHAP